MNGETLKRIGLIAGVVYGIAFLFVFAIIVGSVLSLRANIIYHWTELQSIDEFTMTRGGAPDADTLVSLPTTLYGLTPGERVVLSTEIRTTIHDNLMVKTTTAPLNIYINNNLFLASGMEGTFPAFQKQPAPDIAEISIPESAGAQSLRLEYTVLAGSDTLEIPMVYIGDSQVLFAQLLAENWLVFTIAILLLLGGIVLVCVGLVVASRVPSASSLFWLGFACLTTGLWGFCSNDLALYLIPLPSLLYTLSCVGLFSIGIPFLKYGSILLAPNNRLLLDVLFNLMRLLLLAILILHLAGVIPFAVSELYMQFMTPAALVIFTAYIIFEHFARQNPQAVKLAPPMVLFVVFVLASALNTAIPFLKPEGLLLQVGALIFASWMTLLGWGYVRDIFDEAEKSVALQAEIQAMNRSLDMQRTLYNNLTRSNEEVRVLRHDLRHQLSAIRGYLQNNDVDGALGYVETIGGSIPDLGNKLLCENFAVNAVAVHYLDKALSEHIQTDIKLVVPTDLGCIPDNDMCVIIGNLFENAIEACEHLPDDKRFIKMHSTVAKNRLTLVIDNSFDGNYRVVKGDFYSRKREGKGIGISSVRAIVEKYDGALKYEAANGVFMTSLYVKM